MYKVKILFNDLILDMNLEVIPRVGETLALRKVSNTTVNIKEYKITKVSHVIDIDTCDVVVYKIYLSE